MYCKSITYTDYNGVKTTEDYYFNLSKAELLEMEMERDGGMVEYLNTIVESTESKEVIAVFKDLIRRSVGRKSADGKHFVKDENFSNEFMSSEAYSELFIELLTNAEEAANFVNRIMPQDLAAQAAERRNAMGTQTPMPNVAPTPVSDPNTGAFQPPMQAPMPNVMSNPQPNA